MPERHGPPSPNQRSLLLPVLVTFFIVAVTGCIFLYSFSEIGERSRAKKLHNPVPPTPAALAAGKNIYIERCQNCHGVTGDGKGPKSEELSVAPADFRDVRLMSRSTDGDLFWRITKGARPMPSFATLSEEERWQAVDYIRTFAQLSPSK